jgi:hypothetical protein
MTTDSSQRFGDLLRRSRLAAGLTQEDLAALAGLSVHRGVSLLQFDTRFWNGTGAWPGVSTGNISTNVGFQNCWDVTRGQSGTTGIIVNYTGGKGAAEEGRRAAEEILDDYKNGIFP